MVQKEYSIKTITNQIKNIKNREKSQNHEYQSKNHKKKIFKITVEKKCANSSNK